jgi:hypothetical protein
VENARVGDERVEPAERIEGDLYRGADVLAVTDVGAHERRARPRRASSPRVTSRPVKATAAPRREAIDDRSPDAGCAPGDESADILQTLHARDHPMAKVLTEGISSEVAKGS